MLVAIAFRRLAYQLPRFGITILAVRMALGDGLRTDQFPSLPGIAVFCMDMNGRVSGLRHGVAAFGVRMRSKLRQLTPQVPLLVIAGRIVLMHNKTGVAADRTAAFIIAVLRMFMNFQRTHQPRF